MPLKSQMPLRGPLCRLSAPLNLECHLRPLSPRQNVRSPSAVWTDCFRLRAPACIKAALIHGALRAKMRFGLKWRVTRRLGIVGKELSTELARFCDHLSIAARESS